jgi:hypothetical protein
MAFTEDLTAFFNVDDFAVAATLNGATVKAIFDNNYELGSVGPFGMSGTQPTLTLSTADVPTDPIGKSAVVNGKTYTIAVHQPDGTGVSQLLLEVAV